jgi:hypothetical protein
VTTDASPSGCRTSSPFPLRWFFERMSTGIRKHCSRNRISSSGCMAIPTYVNTLAHYIVGLFSLLEFSRNVQPMACANFRPSPVTIRELGTW